MSAAVSTHAPAPAAQTPPAPAELSAMVQEIDRRALTRYPRTCPGRVTLFVTEKEAATAEPAKEPCVVFGKLAAGGLDVHAVVGDHNSIVLEPYVQDLAQQFRTCVDDLRSGRSFLGDVRRSA